MLSHRNLVSNAAMVIPALGYGPDSIYLHAAPMFHLADGMSTFGLTMLGGTHAFVQRFDPADVLAEIARNRVTHTVLVPTMINAASPTIPMSRIMTSARCGLFRMAARPFRKRWRQRQGQCFPACVCSMFTE